MTVTELLDRMDSRELSEWIAYFGQGEPVAEPEQSVEDIERRLDAFFRGVEAQMGA